MRESEVDRLWSLYNIKLDHIHHLRTKFYTGDTFNPLPKIEEDVKLSCYLYLFQYSFLYHLSYFFLFCHRRHPYNKYFLNF